MTVINERPTISSSEEKIFNYLRLIRSENVGPASFYSLINQYKSAENALLKLEELSKVKNNNKYKLAAKEDIEKEMIYAAKNNIKFITYNDPEYPTLLRHSDMPPPIISVRGNSEIFKRRSLSVVGSRNASAAGIKITYDLVGQLNEHNIVAVSGLARGIDTAAHMASLKYGTIAVLAGGLKHIYPAENIKLYHSIIDNGGAIVSEAPIGYVARALDFPRRNRIVAGCGMGLLVIEAAARSGTLITARMSADMGRIVFAVPGSPIETRALGTNRLIKNGATMVTAVEDILKLLEPLYAQYKTGGFNAKKSDNIHQQMSLFDNSETVTETETETLSSNIYREEPLDLKTKVINQLSVAPISIDWLIQTTGCNFQDLVIILTELEISGKLQRHVGGLVSIKIK